MSIRALREKVVRRLRVNAKTKSGGSEGLDLTREIQRSVLRVRVIQRLLAHAVSRQEELALLSIPYRECPHPVAARTGVRAPRAICREHHFRIRSGARLLAFPLELRSQLEVVVDLAVVDDDVSPVPTVHGLSACVAQVNDAQAAVSEGY